MLPMCKCCQFQCCHWPIENDEPRTTNHEPRTTRLFAVTKRGNCKTSKNISRQVRKVREVLFHGRLCELSGLCVKLKSRFCNWLKRLPFCVNFWHDLRTSCKTFLAFAIGSLGVWEIWKNLQKGSMTRRLRNSKRRKQWACNGRGVCN